jgi:UDP-N-acetylmuramate dehydrogenase
VSPEVGEIELSRQVCDAIEVLGSLGQVDASLAEHTTFRIGGPAAVLVGANCPDDLDLVRVASFSSGLPVVSIGQGSNLLIADAGVAAIVVILGGEFSSVTIDNDARAVRAGAAVRLPVLARRTVAASLSGIEWAVGVPGSVGGGVRMNAGGHGSDMAANTVSAQIIRMLAVAPDTGRVTLTATELNFGYRSSSIGPHDLVEFVDFQLIDGDQATGELMLSDIVQWRRSHQPGGANCGSVFTNPPNDSAGRLIDQAGLKGLRVGSASVSEKHANFIQADPGGRASDVWAVITEVRRRILELTGVDLHPEVQTLGLVEFRRANHPKP